MQLRIFFSATILMVVWYNTYPLLVKFTTSCGHLIYAMGRATDFSKTHEIKKTRVVKKEAYKFLLQVICSE